MKILITGAKGFIGKNLLAELKNLNYSDIYEYDIDTKEELLEEYCKDCEFIFNLAGVNRPKDEKEFLEGNFGFVSNLLKYLKKYNNTCPIMNSSSTQALINNPYGNSKKMGENLFFEYGKESGAKIYVYRFPNVFGKWSKPNYNSAIATFCNNISHDIPIQVNDENTKLKLVYIDDVMEELISALKGQPSMDKDGYCFVPVSYEVTLGEIVNLLYSFKESRDNLYIPDVTKESFSKKLYSTYLSFLPTDKFSYPLKMNADERGSFTEILKSSERGQFSVNISKPGITKGNHWHHTKNEKFVVVSGQGIIRFRKIGTNEIIEYNVSGDNIEVVDIPTGFTHNIINKGDTDLVTFMWCNECFDKEKPDTYFEKVELEE